MLGKVNRRQANVTLFKGKNGLFSNRKIVYTDCGSIT